MGSKDSSIKRIRIGVDLGGTKIYAVIFDEDLGDVIGTARNPSNGHEGADKGLATIKKTVLTAMDDAGCQGTKVLSLGIGVPGVVDRKKGILKIAPNLGWHDVPVRKYLENAFGCPVIVLNDVDAGTYGEYKFGAGKKADSLLGIFPGTGLGGGFVVDGTILQGARYSCMEISDLRMGGGSLTRPGDEWPTLEDLTSRLAITSALAVEAYRGKAPSLVGLPISEIKSKAIEKAIDAKEQAVVEVLDKSIHLLGIGIAGAVSLLGPDVVVLGGGLVDRFSDRYVKALQKGLEKWVTPTLMTDLKVVAAALGDDATAKGAAAYAAAKSK